MKRPCALLGIALFLFAAIPDSASAEGRNEPPPRTSCMTDDDCSGCERCSEERYCQGASIVTTARCMCNADCERVDGAETTVCVLSPSKPLCGGFCAYGPPSSIACSTGADAMTLEAFTGAITEHPNDAFPTGVVILAEPFR